MTTPPTRHEHDSMRVVASRLRLPRSRPLYVLSGVAFLIAVLAGAGPSPALFGLLAGAWISLVLAVTLPSRSQRASDAISQQLARFRHVVSAVGDTPTRVELERALSLAKQLDLPPAEIADDVARLRASMAALALAEQLRQGRLPIVRTDAPLPPGVQCHFQAPVRHGRRRSDHYGQLLLTSERLKFRGAVDMSVAWSEVHEVQRAGTIVIVGLSAQHSWQFACRTLEEAARAGVLADYLRRTTVPNEASVVDARTVPGMC